MTLQSKAIPGAERAINYHNYPQIASITHEKKKKRRKAF